MEVIILDVDWNREQGEGQNMQLFYGD